MITLDLGTIEYYDDVKNEFVSIEGGIVRFEYSLKVLYDWEGRWRKAFLKGENTDEEVIDFYRRMALDPIDDRFITGEVMSVLSEYIKDSHTATTFSAGPDGQNGNNSNVKTKIHTAEEFYAMMFNSRIPIEFENRNLNRLMVVLKIMASYNESPKKMNKQDILRQNRSLNAQRKAKLNTKG